MTKFFTVATAVRAFRATILLGVTVPLVGCPAATPSNNNTANQPARTFQRGGDPQGALDTTNGAGHSAANNSNNIGGGFGRQAAMGGSR